MSPNPDFLSRLLEATIIISAALALKVWIDKFFEKK